MRMITLIVLSLTFFTIYSQVGINENNPSQVLDVGGKIKIGTDGRTPTPGTIAYVTSAGDFWGYTNNGYKSLTKSGTLPSNPLPVTCFSGNINSGFTYYLSLFTWDGTEYTTVPAGKKIIITGLYPTSAMENAANQFYNLEFSADDGISPIPYTRIRISGYDNESRSFSGDSAPLIVLNEGERLRAYGVPDSSLAMNVAIRGFMVDDLDYD